MNIESTVKSLVYPGSFLYKNAGVDYGENRGTDKTLI